MPEGREDVAVVLHSWPWKESSLILRVLTRSHGRIGVVGRGLRGRNRGHVVLPGQPVTMQWVPGRELGTLQSLHPLPPLRALPGGDNWWALQYVLEVLLQVAPENEPQDGLLDDYLRVLDALSEAGADPAAPLRRFEWAVLRSAGLAVDLCHDSDGRPTEDTTRYVLVADAGLQRSTSRQARPGAHWRALVQGHLEADVARGLRPAVQRQLERLVDFSRLRSREQWRAARRLRDSLSAEGGPPR
ncbi:MAG: DNA repair protein RecO C-terminal domain-containing protein [Oceanococcaceae bacterium]